MASPDWRDQVLYFVLTDRFANGDPRNDDQGAGEFDTGRPDRYQGGDLRGLTQRLDYIQGLGATGVWITPPVANQWLAGGHAGYHGYWAEHFGRVDRHLGTPADLQGLSRALHARGMFLVQDIVVNHTGDFFDIAPGTAADQPGAGWKANPGSTPQRRPSQAPFHLNDARQARDRAAAIYHWTPPVADYTDATQLLDHQMSGLDDLNTENPVVRRALRRSYGEWIRSAGVDAFRVDTAFYVPPDFFDDFLHSSDRTAPGIAEVARRTGRRDFLVFGEGFGIDRPFDDTQARRIETYATRADGRPRLPGMLNFPLYGALADVFARGRPPAELAHRIEALARVHARPHRMPSFVDNHDVDRFLAGGDPAGLKQALLALMTLPGIPVITYGTEQGFVEPRASMFAAGWGSGGRDRFDRGAPLYRYLASVIGLRREHRVLSRGWPRLLHAGGAGPGAIAWLMVEGDERVLVALNTAADERLLPALALGPGARLEPLYGIDGAPSAMSADARGRVSVRVPARGGAVWRVRAGTVEPAVAAVGPALSIQAPTGPLAAGRSRLSGRAPPGSTPRLVIDGDLAHAAVVAVDADGRWQAEVDTASMIDEAVAHAAVLWDEAAGAASDPVELRVEPPWRLAADLEDPAGDDHGPDGRYRYPTDPSWGPNRQMDLQRVRAFVAGGALRLELSLAAVTTSWNPANGFDHVAFTIFVQLPGRTDGASAMPLQQSHLPGELRWHRRLRVHGWSNALFEAQGAGASAEGRPTGPAARIDVDRDARRVTLTLPPAALGGLASLAGARVYVTTWDWDGGYRAGSPEGGTHTIGGVGPEDPRIMDASAVIELR